MATKWYHSAIVAIFFTTYAVTIGLAARQQHQYQQQQHQYQQQPHQYEQQKHQPQQQQQTYAQYESPDIEADSQYNDYIDYQPYELGQFDDIADVGPVEEEEEVKYKQPSAAPQPVIILKKKEEKQDFSKIPGVPGVDFPIYHVVPKTSFSCAHVPTLPGMYANVETGCQAYHVCHDGREGDQGASFLCANGTLFNQEAFNCDWWYNVDCAHAPSLYSLNSDPEKNPYVPAAHKEAIRQDRLRIVVL